MKYQVIARKFRPQTFSEVVGQKPIVQILQNAIKLNRIGHAYLFCGPRGVGKTTMARLLAKGLNCANGPTIEPDNECPSCREIAAGQSMDVLEIDAASNTGVDSVRELRDSARYAPSRDRNKIFIIDEVHMLSTSAFNALLKILEEPPLHVVFIMATTERQKLPATILSRCQQFVFRTIAPAEIHAHLKEIVKREGAAVDAAALNYIVKAAEGSMRDAQSLLEQIISFSGEAVESEDVRDVLGFIPREILDRTIDSIAASNGPEMIEIVSVVVDQGLSLQQYVRELIARMRDMLMIKLKVPDKVLGTDEEKAELAGRAESFSEQDLIRYFDLLLRLEIDTKYSAQPRFHLEVGLVKLAKTGHMKDIEEVLRDLKGAAPKPAGTPSIPQPAPSAKPSSSPPSRVPPPVTPPTRAMATASPITASAAAPAPISKPEPKAPVSESAMDSAKQEPLVKSFLAVFRGDIAQVKPPKEDPQ
jgi:DNA polymerase-3 subunit gamma/tau